MFWYPLAHLPIVFFEQETTRRCCGSQKVFVPRHWWLSSPQFGVLEGYWIQFLGHFLQFIVTGVHVHAYITWWSKCIAPVSRSLFWFQPASQFGRPAGFDTFGRPAGLGSSGRPLWDTLAAWRQRDDKRRILLYNKEELFIKEKFSFQKKHDFTKTSSAVDKSRVC